MKILGIADFAGSHDMSAAIVCDGKLVAAAEEERFTRNKHQGGLAFHAIEYCLEAAGVAMSGIDVIAFADLPYRSGRDSQLADTDVGALQQLHATGHVRRRSLWHKRTLNALSSSGLPLPPNIGLAPHVERALASLSRQFGPLAPITFHGHHRCHAATAFFTSDVEEAAVVTVDGRGGNYSCVSWHAHGRELRRLGSQPFTNSLGHFYGDCAEYLGFGEFGQGKMMGLAPYGDAGAAREAVARVFTTSTEGGPYRYLRPPSAAAVGFESPGPHADITAAPYRDFAAAAQEALQMAMLALCESAVAATGSSNLCLGGGVALNCSANGHVLAAGIADNIWLFPPCGDAGLSIGAALLCAQQHGEPRHSASHAFWGPGFTDAQCHRAVQAASGVACRQVKDVAGESAQLLESGKVLGWFQGRMEIGPRALGNRSILADPRSGSMRDRVNRIKRRESWRPLAPAVLRERAHEFFSPAPPVPFMLFAVQVLPQARERLAGVTHVDGSARPQLVEHRHSPRFHELISAFGERTGTPVLLNTSFNLAGEPIVCTPQDAIRTFQASELDALVMGDLIVTRQS